MPLKTIKRRNFQVGIGGGLVVGRIGALATKLISLAVNLTNSVAGTVGSSIGSLVVVPGRMPNSVTSLSPKNPTLKVLDSTQILADYHTILGDQGKGNPPDSTDGVVAYWTHLAGGKSERVVPGPLGACELPETLNELRRTLHRHLKSE